MAALASPASLPIVGICSAKNTLLQRFLWLNEY
jgi:hypothetical protein